jgi:hypothetical protein
VYCCFKQHSRQVEHISKSSTYKSKSTSQKPVPKPVSLLAGLQAEVHHIQAAAEGSLWGSRSADVLTAAQLLVQELEEDGAQVKLQTTALKHLFC